MKGLNFVKSYKVQCTKGRVASNLLAMFRILILITDILEKHLHFSGDNLIVKMAFCDEMKVTCLTATECPNALQQQRDLQRTLFTACPDYKNTFNAPTKVFFKSNLC